MTRLSARYLYSLDTLEPILNGFVEVDDEGTVLRTGTVSDPREEPEMLPGALVPGFVNAHCHIELSYLWNRFRKGTGMAGFIDQINEWRDTLPLAERQAVIRRWMDRLWDRGVSAMADISNGSDSFPVKAASPLYTRTFLEVFGTEPSDCPAVMEAVCQLTEVARAAGLDAAPTPHACYTMSPDLLTAASAAALASGFLSYHSEESPQEEEMLRSGTGEMAENRRRAGMSMPPVTGTSSLLYFLDRLARVHEPPFPEHVLLVHEVCMDQEGIDAVRRVMQHPFIALCPLSNIFIHEMLPPVRLFREQGLKLTVGTDSLSSNDDLDMVSELFCLQQNFPEIPLGELFTWACRNGAEFLGKEDRFGTFLPGRRPGVVYVDHLDRAGRLTVASTSKRMI